MTALVTRFAIVGRQYPTEAYADLHMASVSARAERKRRAPSGSSRRWCGPTDSVVLPKQLSA